MPEEIVALDRLDEPDLRTGHSYYNLLVSATLRVAAVNGQRDLVLSRNPDQSGAQYFCWPAGTRPPAGLELYSTTPLGTGRDRLRAALGLPAVPSPGGAPVVIPADAARVDAVLAQLDRLTRLTERMVDVLDPPRIVVP